MFLHAWCRSHASVLLAAGLAVGLVVACDRSDTRVVDADNTAKNVRDKDGGSPTPLDQGNSEADRAITQHIRKVVVDDDALSTNAHNVKIITQDGVVTLRGPVNTPAEKNTIVAAAQGAPGIKRVDDQLEVQATD